MNFNRPNPAKKTVALGDHDAICVGIWDLGLQPSGFPDKLPSHKLAIGWELRGGDFVSCEYGQEIKEWDFVKEGKRIKGESKLRKHLRTWFECAPKSESFVPRKLIGQHCVLVVGATSGGYPKVEGIRPQPQAKRDWDAVTPPMYYEIGDPEIPAGTTNWIVRQINSRLPEPESGEESQEVPEVNVQSNGSRSQVPF